MMRRSEAPILQFQPPGGRIGIGGEDKGTVSLYFCIAGSDGRLMALVGNLVFCLWEKSEIESMTPNTAFRFNSKDNSICIIHQHQPPARLINDYCLILTCLVRPK
jgi:hypothetical protein